MSENSRNLVAAKWRKQSTQFATALENRIFIPVWAFVALAKAILNVVPASISALSFVRSAAA
jgi:hypothetical protein